MKFLSLLVILLPLGSHAASSIGTRGGGDLCEDRIEILRDDIKAWILDGGFNALVLPEGVKKASYQTDMLKQIKKAKIKCVGKGDVGYPVSIDDTPKVCKFEDSQITCDYDKFMSMKGADQYVLIHHEYAGLAGVELPNGADSDYTISNQLSGHLVDQVEKKLSLAPKDKNLSYTDRTNLCRKDAEIIFAKKVKYPIEVLSIVQVPMGDAYAEHVIVYKQKSVSGSIFRAVAIANGGECDFKIEENKRLY